LEGQTISRSASQSFGAWVTKGVRLELEGDGNDGVGKGLCGGKLIVYLPLSSPFFRASQNIIVGNAALYGATSGQAFFCGMAAERFAVRSSGAEAMVEGAGDHCCEYMTGGRVIILGQVGRNFTAGMSGGMAFVWCPTPESRKAFDENCNHQTVSLIPVSDEESIKLIELIKLHKLYTNSNTATDILKNWQITFQQFVQVYPHDYKRVIEEEILKTKEELWKVQLSAEQLEKQHQKSLAESKLFTIDEIKLEQSKRQNYTHALG